MTLDGPPIPTDQKVRSMRRKCGCPVPNPPWEYSRQPEPVKAPSASLRDRLRRPLTEPRLPSGSAAVGFGERAGQGSGRAQEPQLNRLFCKPICKPNAARQDETGETEPMERDGNGPVRRGRRGRARRPEMSETHVVWLITQRSQVQILPPLLVSAGKALPLPGEGPFACRAL